MATAKPSSTGSIIIRKNNKDKWLFNTKQTDCSAFLKIHLYKRM